MEITLLIIIIFVVLLAIVLIAHILRTTAKIENRGHYNFVIKLSNKLIILSLCIYYILPSLISFHLSDEQKRYCELHLPQIDSLMQLVLFNENMIEFKSIAKDSIRHEFKTIYRDLIGYDRMEDVFVNEKLNVRMKVNFTFPNIVRHSKRINTVTWNESDTKPKYDEISTPVLDSILKSWGLKDRTYQTRK